jgi:hypothetical protein
VYAAVSYAEDGTIAYHLLTKITPDSNGLDLATAAIEYESSQVVGRHPAPNTVGTDVWSVGFPLPESDLIDNDLRRWHLDPRILKGYVTRIFINQNHKNFGPQPSYELDMPMPLGMSGAPILANPGSPMGPVLLGVAYGSHDSYTIAEETVIEEPGYRQEARRYVSFGWAHHLDSVMALRGEATNDRPLSDLLTPGW